MIAGLLVLALTAALIGWKPRETLEHRLARYRAAHEPTTLAELQAWYEAVPDAENAGLALMKANAAWRRTSSTNLPTAIYGRPYPKLGEAWPTPMIEATRAELAVNREPLAQIYRALQRPRSRYPASLVTGTSLAIMSADQLGENLSLEARWAAETGDPERAAAALLALLGVARTWEEDPLLDGYRIRLALNRLALDTTAQVLSRMALPDARLRQLQQAFADAEGTRQLRQISIGIRCVVLNQLTLPSPRYFELLRLRQLLPGAMARVDAGLRRLDALQTLDLLDELAGLAERPPSEVAAELRRRVTKAGNAAGGQDRMHVMSRQTGLLQEQMIRRVAGSVALLRCGQIAVAVERWRLAHGGALPVSLGDLVPQFLPAVREDPFDGKPLKYRRLTPAPGYEVYSVGEDGRDDTARGRPGDPLAGSGQDLPFRVMR
jgi:hypothetical protein